MVTIYVDTLIFINMFVTYFLLLATQLICRRTLRRFRLLAASALGGVYALTILLKPIPPYLSVPMHITACILLCIAADGIRSVRQFLKTLFVFLPVNFLFAGLMLALQLLRPGHLLYNSGVVYFDINTPFLLLATLAAFLLIRLLMRLSAGRNDQSVSVDLLIHMDNKTLHCIGMTDTGHCLKDTFTGKPVLIMNKKLAASLVPPSIHFFLQNKELSAHTIPPAYIGKLRLFPYQSVGTQGLLPAFRCDRVEITVNHTKNTYENIYIAATDTPLFGGEADVLLPPEVCGETKGENRYAVSYHRLKSALAAHSSDAVRTARSLRRDISDSSPASQQERGNRGTRPTCRR